MKRILLYLLLGFCCIHVGVKINALIGEKGKAEVITEFAKDPTTIDEATELKRQAEKRKKDAQDKYQKAEEAEKAKKEGATDDKEKAELEAKIAERDLQTADIFIDNNKAYTEWNEEKAKEYEEKAQKEEQARKKIDTEIGNLKAKIALSYQAPQQGQITDRDIRVRQSYVTNIFTPQLAQKRSSIELDNYLNKILFSNLTGFGYGDQARILDGIIEKIESSKKEEALSRLLNRSSNEEKEAIQKVLQEFTEKANKRITEIKQFLQNPPPKPKTALEMVLELDKKIVSEQMLAIDTERTKVIQDLSDALATENTQLKENALDQLKNISQAMQDYKLQNTYPDEATLIKQITNDLQEKSNIVATPEIEQQSGILNQAYNLVAQGTKSIGDAAANLAGNLLPGSVVEGAQVTIDNVASLIAGGKEIWTKGTQYAIKRIPEIMHEDLTNLQQDLVKKNKQLTKIAAKLEKASQVMGLLAVELPGMIRVIQKLTTAANYIPLLGGTIVAKLEKIERPLQDALRDITKAEGAIDKKSWTVWSIEAIRQGISTALPMIEDIRMQLAPEQLQRDVERASWLIEQEKDTIKTTEQTNKYKKAMQPLIDFGKRVADWFKNLFASSQADLTKALKNYDLARTQYLIKLGFNQQEIDNRPTEDKIKEKLKIALQDPARKKDVELATKMLARAMLEITTVYNDFATQLSNTMASYEFLVRGWDTAVVNYQRDSIANMATTLFDLRELRFGYLQSLRDGVEQLRKDVNATAKESDLEPLSKEFVDRISAMISGQMVDDMNKYYKNASLLDQMIKKTVKDQGIPGSGK